MKISQGEKAKITHSLTAEETVCELEAVKPVSHQIPNKMS